MSVIKKPDNKLEDDSPNKPGDASHHEEFIDVAARHDRVEEIFLSAVICHKPDGELEQRIYGMLVKRIRELAVNGEIDSYAAINEIRSAACRAVGIASKLIMRYKYVPMLVIETIVAQESTGIDGLPMNHTQFRRPR